MTCSEMFLVDLSAVLGFNSGDVIGLSCNVNSTIRVNPDKNDVCDIFNSNKISSLNGWIIHFNENKHLIKLQNVATKKFLRINKNKIIDVKGGGGKWTGFKLYKTKELHTFKLESNMHPNCFISVSNNIIKISNGDDTCKIKFIINNDNTDEGNDTNGYPLLIDIKQDNDNDNKNDDDDDDDGDIIKIVRKKEFKSYKFDKDNIIVSIIHNYCFNNRIKYNTIRMNPNDNDTLCSKGGFGQWAKWKIFIENNNIIRLQSIKTNKFIRIINNNINIKGNGGRFTKFKCILVKKSNIIKLESCVYPGKFIGVNKDSDVYICNGNNQDCYLKFVENPFGNNNNNNDVNDLKNDDIIHVRQIHNNKHLRINPKNHLELNTQGGFGKFAKWVVIMKQQKPMMIQLKNVVSNKFLRIVRGGNAINVGGSGGKFCDFLVKYQDNYIKLESNLFQNKFVGVKQNGDAFVDKGGNYCLLSIIKTQFNGNIGCNHSCNCNNKKRNNNSINLDLKYNKMRTEINSLKILLNTQQKQIIQLQNALLNKQNNELQPGSFGSNYKPTQQVMHSPYYINNNNNNNNDNERMSDEYINIPCDNME